MCRWIPAILLFVLWTVPVGAMGAPPVAPTRDFYVNDYAGLLFQPHRTDMLEISRDLEKQAGVQLVVLTVGGLQGRDIGAYGQAVVQSWPVGGRGGVLILVAAATRECRVVLGSGLEGLGQYRQASVDFARGDVSGQVLELYRAIAGDTYRLAGISPDAAMQRRLSGESESGSGVVGALRIVFFAAMGLLVLRACWSAYRHHREYIVDAWEEIDDESNKEDEEPDDQDNEQEDTQWN